MSRHYEMHVLVKGFDKTREDDIDTAIQDVWGMQDSWDEDGGHLWSGDGTLGQGMLEEEFARRMRNAVWEANGAFCEVEVRCIYLDDPPTSYHVFNEEDYKKWKELQLPLTPASETSSETM